MTKSAEHDRLIAIAERELAKVPTPMPPSVARTPDSNMGPGTPPAQVQSGMEPRAGRKA